MAREEFSAGFVVFRLSPGPPHTRLYLLLDYGRHWDYAKGHVKKGETKVSAALRELKEETGISDAEVIPGFAQEIRYFFRHKHKGLIHKSVTVFLARTAAVNVALSDEHVGFAFLAYEDARQRLTFNSAREVLQLAEEFLARRDTEVDSLS